MSSPASNRHPVVTADDHGAIVTIATYFLMITFILSVIIRIVIRLVVTRFLGIDDYIVAVATVFGVGQAVAVLEGVHNGLGKKEKLLNAAQVTSVAKAQYTSDILFLIALCLAKISVLLLLRRLAVTRSHKRFTLVVVGVVIVWALTGVVVIAAQCGSSLPWHRHASSKCIDVRAFWIGMAPVDLLVELVTVLLPVIMLIPVQVSTSKKAVIVTAFVFRVLVIIATIVRLFYLHPATESSPDATFNAVNYNILTLCVLSFSITTACIPGLKPFLDGFESGMLGVSFKDRLGGSKTRSTDYKMNSLGKSATKSPLNSILAIRSGNFDRDSDKEEDSAQQMGVSVMGGGQHGRERSSRNHRRGGTDVGDSASVASSSKSDQMIIKKNLEWTVQYEEAPAARTVTSLSKKPSTSMTDDKSEAETVHHPHDDSEEDGRRPAYAV